MDRRLQLQETILRGDVATFLSLIQEDENFVNEKFTTGSSSNTILHLAARFGPLELAKEILKMKPEMASEVNEKWETPLYEACREGRTDMVKVLVESDPCVVYKVNKENQSGLFAACERGKLEVVDYLLNFQHLLVLEVDAPTTSLHVAAFGGYTGN